MRVSRRAEAATVVAILTIVFASVMAGVGLAALFSVLTGYAPRLDLPLPVRFLGVPLVAAGVFSIAIVLRYRSPRDVLDSTAVTLLKFYRRTPLESHGGRTEPFIPRGPYRYVRNPMYTGAVCIAFGFAVTFASVAFLFWGAVLTIWFWFVWIPFEERELEALFGDGYLDYKRRVPKLFPSGRVYKTQESLERLVALQEVPPVAHVVELAPDNDAHRVMLDVEDPGGAESMESRGKICGVRFQLGDTTWLPSSVQRLFANAKPRADTNSKTPTNS